MKPFRLDHTFEPSRDPRYCAWMSPGVEIGSPATGTVLMSVQCGYPPGVHAPVPEGELTFARIDGRVYLISPIARVIKVTRELMDTPGEGMIVKGDVIAFAGHNGSWRYQVIGEGTRVVVARLIEDDLT